MRLKRPNRHVDQLEAIARRVHAHQDGTIGFAAVSVDADRKAAAARGGGDHWPHLELLHLPAATIHALQVGTVPSRLVLDARTGRVARWWDGTHGNVLLGKHGKSRRNGSHDLLGTLVALL